MTDLKPASVPLRRHRVAAAVGLFAIFLFLLPSLTLEYGMTDDYPRLVVLPLGWVDFWSSDLTRDGRILSTPFILGGFSAAETVENLKFLRILGWLFALAFSFILLRHFLAEGFDSLTSLFLSVLIGLSPAFIVFMGWTSTYPYALGAALAFVGGYLGFFRRSIGGAGLLLLASLLVYQPVAAIFFLPAAIHLWSKNQLPLKHHAHVVLLHVGVLGTYWVVYQIYARTDPVMSGLRNRAELTTDWSQKFHYLSHIALPEIASGWLIFLHPYSWIGVAILLIATVYLVILNEGQRRAWTVFATWAVYLGLAMAPLLATRDNVYGYRVQVSAMCLFAVFLAYPLQRLLPRQSRQVRSAILIPALFLVSLVPLLGLHFGIALPQHREWRSHLAHAPSLEAPNELRLIAYRVPIQRRRDITFSRNEFGAISSAMLPSVPSTIIPLAQIRNGHFAAHEVTSILEASNIIPFPAWVAVPEYMTQLDGRQIVLTRSLPPAGSFRPEAWRNPPERSAIFPILGEVERLLGEWHLHPKIGPFADRGFPHIRLPFVGNVEILAIEEDGYLTAQRDGAVIRIRHPVAPFSP